MEKQELFQKLKKLKKQEFTCRKEGCGEKATYWYNDSYIDLLIKMIETNEIESDEIEFETDNAYLTCDNGHTYTYPIEFTNIKKHNSNIAGLIEKMGNVARIIKE